MQEGTTESTTAFLHTLAPNSPDFPSDLNGNLHRRHANQAAYSI